MPDISLLGVVGIDGIVPVYDPEGRWCWWSIDEIFREGTPGQDRYVPKVRDYVIDPDTFVTWRVTHLDNDTLYPTLVQIRPANMSFSLSETDVLFGVGPGTQSDTYRAYLDKSVTPFVLNVERRLKIGGTMASYAKIFRGADTGDQTKIVSRVYDSAGNFITDRVPLELCAIDSHVNYSIKIVTTCNTNFDLVDGEIVTVVIYSADGHVVSKRQLLVENTAFIAQLNVSQKYVTGIAMKSAFLSSSQDNTIEYPLDTPMNALNLMGVVHYSDGSSRELPVDGTKFRIIGLEQFVSTIIGQNVNLVLSYALGPDEVVYGAVTSDNKYVTQPYRLRVIDPNNSYRVKVFGYPVWIDSANGYRMKWFLFNLDRNIWFDVTEYVMFAPNTGTFDPKGYGYTQRKAIQLNLRDVSGAFKPYIHTQIFDINLITQPNGDNTPWTVLSSNDSNDTPYGPGLHAQRLSASAGQTLLKLDSGIATQAEWTNQVYGKTYPLMDRMNELAPPAATHFEISYGGVKNTYAISSWNATLSLAINVPIYGTVMIRFYRIANSAEVHLSEAAMLVTS